MIFFFTGTGNSLDAAQQMATRFEDQLISIAEAINHKTFDFDLKPEEKIGFVFPIYFWGVPSIVADFIAQLKLHNYHNQYIYTVLTCGGSVGQAHRLLSKMLFNKGYRLNAAFSVQMPDNYILMFQINTPAEKVSEILNSARKRMHEIMAVIEKQGNSKKLLTKGATPWIYTSFFYPIYRKGRKTKPFFVTDSCTSCGLCESICPSKVISLEKGLPIWKEGQCVQCLACIHRCPESAIQYGKRTIPIERYVNPVLK